MFHSLTSKRMVASGAVLAGLLTLAGCGTQARNARNTQQYLVTALQSAQVKPTDTEARQWVDRAIALEPKSADLYLGPSTPQSQLDPSTPTLSVAEVFAAAGDDPALADYMTQAVQKFPADPRGYSLLLEADNRLGRTADRKAIALKEIALLTKALQTPGAQNIPVQTEELAQAYWYAGDSVNGTAQYKKAIAAYPALSSYGGGTGPYDGLAYAEADANSNLPEAAALAQKALAQAKQSPDVKEDMIADIQDTIAWVQYHQGQYADAEQNLLDAANTSPRLPEIRYHLGVVYAAQGNTPAARAELTHALQLSQGYAAAQTALDTLPKTTVTASL